MSLVSLFAIALGVSANSCQFIAGNYYCDETNLVQYNNVGLPGSYDRVTSFNNDGTCSSVPQGFSGSLSPLDEELSVHFRGPIRLDHFQVYKKSGNSFNKRELHHRHADPEPIIITEYAYHTEYVYVTADAETVSVTPAAPTPDSATSSISQSYNDDAGSSIVSAVSQSKHYSESQAVVPSLVASSSSSSSAAIPTNTPVSGSSWTQVANYDGAAGSANGLVFLNNLGGQQSGVFDFTFGNSLSYAGADGISSAAGPETLSHTTIPSNKEFSIFSSDKCEGDACGYYRPGTVAYHGFGGPHKVFVFEFSMPSDGSFGFNADMPAVWLLNAQIPRTLQYGAKSCSCWASGCGELDLWEVLNSGNDRMVTSLHIKQHGGGGSANYFSRPTWDTLKGAVIFDGTTISVVRIDSIPSYIDDNVIAHWLSQAGAPTNVQM